jgi:hypothetical protein
MYNHCIHSFIKLVGSFFPGWAKNEPTKEAKYHAAGILSLTKGRLEALLRKPYTLNKRKILSVYILIQRRKPPKYTRKGVFLLHVSS